MLELVRMMLDIEPDEDDGIEFDAGGEVAEVTARPMSTPVCG